MIGWRSTTNKKEKMYEQGFDVIQKTSTYLFVYGDFYTTGELRLKDQNEYEKNIKKAKEGNRLRWNLVYFDLYTTTY